MGSPGRFSRLYERDYRPECVAGTSAGAITAALVAAGYTGEELKKLVLNEMHFPLFEDRPRFLDTWDFNAYKKKFREGPAPGRRAGILG